ncbi:MAG: enoyl-CoA hydratase/isomerase family protein [Promethearchaeota archaeon]
MTSGRKYEDIIAKSEAGICTITLNRPERLNAIQYPTILEILDVFESIMKDNSARVIVFKGTGRAFCSGDDLVSMGPDDFPPLDPKYKLPHHKLICQIREIEIPVIAQIHGYCLGAGFELALACDFRIAANDLEMGDHRTRRAICMLHGASWFLPRLIGLARATEIVFTGKHLDAKEALEIGLVNRVYPVSQFNEKSKEFIQRIAEMPTKCLGYNKAMFNYSFINDLTSSLQNEFNLFTTNMRTYDSREGHRSFLEKRDPEFKGK